MPIDPLSRLKCSHTRSVIGGEEDRYSGRKLPANSEIYFACSEGKKIARELAKKRSAWPFRY